MPSSLSQSAPAALQTRASSPSRTTRTRSKLEKSGFLDDDEMTDRNYDADRTSVAFKARTGTLSPYGSHYKPMCYRPATEPRLKKSPTKVEDGGPDLYNVTQQKDAKNWHTKSKSLSFGLTSAYSLRTTPSYLLIALTCFLPYSWAWRREVPSNVWHWYEV
jgi:hypothetical protein